ncbi:MAG: hypothetical protein OXU20_18660 [Myxococcales bacterium]|nr:hypothetical protein [Myxococcales bacterium]MDD9967736.1 hypothetical protein [Myxococcales bacterium]
MKLLYPIYGLAVVALYLAIASRGIEPFGVSAERTKAKMMRASTSGRTTTRRHSTFIWLGGYGGK